MNTIAKFVFAFSLCIFVVVLQVCLMGKYHNVLYIALKVAWDFGITNSDVVKNLLCTCKFEICFLFNIRFTAIHRRML